MREALRFGWSALAGALFSGCTFTCLWMVTDIVASRSLDLFKILAVGSGLSLIFSLAVALPVTVALTLACRLGAIGNVRAVALAGGAGTTASALAWFLLLPARPESNDLVLDNGVFFAGCALLAGVAGGWAVSVYCVFDAQEEDVSRSC